ncbi:MAG: hypothetical protein U1F45_14580 [Burkholderiales bacterium]
MFADQERKAFDLGRRMAEAGFGLEDNPFVRIHPRLATQWTHGFFAANALNGLRAALARRKLATPRPQPRLVSAA